MDEFLQEADSDSGFQGGSFGYQADAQFGAAPTDGFTAVPSNKAAQAAQPDNSALIEFQKKFREAGEAKDAKEREQKASKKAAGKAALKKLLAEKTTLVEGRKNKNREDEAATERTMLDSLQGESWSRVVSLIDIHGQPKPAEDKSKNKHEESGTARMRDVLISLKAKPLA